MRHSITPVMNWKQRRRHGISLSRRQFVVLQQLEQSKLAGFEFMDLQGVHKNTLNFLQREDYIFASPGIDGTRYKITYRGLKVLRIFEQPTRNFDDMCPTCCERPKHFYNTGRKAGYCKECLGEMSKRAYKRKGYGIRQDRMCSRCRKFPVHVRKNGRAITYCMHCKNVLGRRQKKRMHKRNIRRIAAAKWPPLRLAAYPAAPTRVITGAMLAAGSIGCIWPSIPTRAPIESERNHERSCSPRH